MINVPAQWTYKKIPMKLQYKLQQEQLFVKKKGKSPGKCRNIDSRINLQKLINHNKNEKF